MKRSLIFYLTLIGLLCIQCNNHLEYSDIINVKNSWNKNDTLNFTFKVQNSENKKNINFIVRNNNDYPFSNIYLFVKLKQGKNIVTVDTLNYFLADNSGKWLGTGVGSVKEINLRYKKEFNFPKNGLYTLSIVQGMRKDTLKGIEDFGVNIE